MESNGEICSTGKALPNICTNTILLFGSTASSRRSTIDLETCNKTNYFNNNKKNSLLTNKLHHKKNISFKRNSRNSIVLFDSNLEVDTESKNPITRKNTIFNISGLNEMSIIKNKKTLSLKNICDKTEMKTNISKSSMNINSIINSSSKRVTFDITGLKIHGTLSDRNNSTKCITDNINPPSSDRINSDIISNRTHCKLLGNNFSKKLLTESTNIPLSDRGILDNIKIRTQGTIIQTNSLKKGNGYNSPLIDRGSIKKSLDNLLNDC